MKQKKQPIVIIVGPTASGKTALAVELARQYDGEVISADSRQVYRGLDIGTEKTTKKEMSGVPHYCIDIASPKRTVSAAQWARHAHKAIDSIAKRGKVPIIAGGTGFYIDALLYPDAFPEVKPNATLRKQLEKKSVQELFIDLKKRDPTRAKNIDPNNKRRLIRALEIAYALGRVPKIKKQQTHFNPIWIGLSPDMQTLEKKLEARLEKTLKKGLIAETKRLLREGLSKKRLYEIGLEYRIALAYIEQRTTKEQMKREMLSALTHYAKRQMRWFVRNKNIRWFTSPAQALSEFPEIHFRRS